MTSKEETVTEITQSTSEETTIKTDSPCEENPENTETDSKKCKKGKKNRPISEMVNGSLKRHTPVFFANKRTSEGTFQENLRKSANDMWKDVKTVVNRLSVNKKDKEKKKAENGNTETQSDSGDQSKGVVPEVEKASTNETNGNHSDDTGYDTVDKAPSKEVVVPDGGGTVE